MNKVIYLILILLAPFQAMSNQCSDIFKSGRQLTRTQYLSYDQYEKIRFFKNYLDPDLSIKRPDNLFKSNSFKFFGPSRLTVSDKILSAGTKALKQFELDQRENSTQFESVVFYEINSENFEIRPWAVLVIQKQIRYNGQSIETPKALYSIERNTAGEAVKLLTARFDDLII